MKTLLTAFIALGITGAALAQNEVPEDIIIGYTVQVMPASSHQLAGVDAGEMNEPLKYSLPGYGVKLDAGRTFIQPEVGSAGEDYLGLVFEGNE